MTKETAKVPTATAAPEPPGQKNFAEHVNDRLKAAQPKAAPRRGLDPEIQALARLDRILAALDPDAAVRAIQWLDGRYGAEARFEVLQGQGEVANGEAT